jgi:CRISPR/Cas system-associated protein Cas10 (large subunit of type III CRISPR-Cas system)
MDKYLYGASVQGIQDFIFATNKLKEIVGASELVEQITNTDFLKEFKLRKEPKKILQAAGNIKLIFNNKEDLAKVVREFPKFAMLKAYGITISQAVVKFEKLDKDVMNELEAKLKEERNKNDLPLDMGLNIISLSPATAKSAVKEVKKDKSGKKKEFIDKSTFQKREASKSKRVSDKMEIERDDEYLDLRKISNTKNKIAVIHADGNGLGRIIQGIGENLAKHPENIEEAYKNFSQILDEATTISAKNAYKTTKEKYPNLKIRPIVLGGDDLTMITDANSALDFVNEYLKEFEKNTKNGFKEFVNEFEIEDFKGLTVCAGIAFCNEKYPFHYAVNLAEELCSEAKNVTREKSSLMFHNIQSSYFTEFKNFKENELIIQNNKREIELSYGPYFVDNNPTINDFLNLSKSLFQKGSPLAKLRNWLSELHNNDNYAQILLDRIDEMASDNEDYSKSILEGNLKKLDGRLELKNLIVDDKTPIYDVLQLHSVVEEGNKK